MCDFGTAVAIYSVFVAANIIERFGGTVPVIKTKITALPDIDLQRYVFFDISDLVRKLKIFPDSLFNTYILSEYNQYLIRCLYNISMYMLMLLPIVILIGFLFKQFALKKDEEDVVIISADGSKSCFKESAPYRTACLIYQKAVLPFFRWCKTYIKYVYDTKIFRFLLAFVWTVNLNALTIVFGVAAYYFYFVATFDLPSLFSQMVKLLVDLIIMFWGAPLIIWLVAFGAIFAVISVRLGYKKLNHMESKNCGYLKTTDYCVMLKGPPGSGKTTLATDFGLSWVNIHKADALDIMITMEMLFPAFSFASLRQALNTAIDSGEIFCIPACDIFADKLMLDSPLPYGYNAEIFATQRNTGTSCATLDKAIRTYSKAYFIYANDNSVMANYPIRFDGNFDDSKHLKKWNGDFFKRNALTAKERSRYAHILMQDVLRMGKKFDYNNKFNGTFGYGIYVNTEWGKSRGNQLTNDDVKKSDNKVNQKNDLYSYSLKMCRHACSTVWHKVFFRFIADEQRPESVEADLRQLTTVIEIKDKSELKLALPFGKILDKTYNAIYEPFRKFFVDYLNCRSDVILSVMLYKFAVAALSRFYSYLYNTFGYYELDLAVEKGMEYDGKGNGEVKIHKYYLMVKKCYADRYNTDCHSAYFTKSQIEAEIGIRDYPTYNGLTQTIEQMDSQCDYFIRDMMKIMKMSDDYTAKKQAKQPEKVTVSNTSDTNGIEFF